MLPLIDLNVENPESIDNESDPADLVTVTVPSKIPVQMAYLQLTVNGFQLITKSGYTDLTSELTSSHMRRTTQ